MLVGTDVCVVYGTGTGEPVRNPPARLGDHMTISHAMSCVIKIRSNKIKMPLLHQELVHKIYKTAREGIIRNF